MMRIILAVVLMIISTQASSVGFLADRQDWEKHSGLAQIGYAMGALDEMIQYMPYDTPEVTAIKDQLIACIVKMQLDSNTLPDIIETHYSDLGNWQDPPQIALRIGLLKVCKMGIYK